MILNIEAQSEIVIDWSCNDLISIGKENCAKVYNSQGIPLTAWSENGCLNVITWNNSGKYEKYMMKCVKFIIQTY